MTKGQRAWRGSDEPKLRQGIKKKINEKERTYHKYEESKALREYQITNIGDRKLPVGNHLVLSDSLKNWIHTKTNWWKFDE